MARAGAQLAFVGNGTVPEAQGFVEEVEPSAPVLTDPELRVYAAAGARRGLRSALHPGTFIASWRAWRSGVKNGDVAGDSQQQGGILVVRPDGSVPYHRMSRFAGDHPVPEEVLRVLRD